MPQNKLIWDVVAVHVSKQKVQKGGCFWCFFNWTSWRIPFRKMHMVIYVSITILDIKWEILTFEINSFASNFNSVLKMIQLSGLLIGHKKRWMLYFEKEAHVDLLWSYHAAHTVSLYFILFLCFESQIFLPIHGCTKIPVLLKEHMYLF